jgi:hypothetical protein
MAARCGYNEKGGERAGMDGWASRCYQRQRPDGGVGHTALPTTRTGEGGALYVFAKRTHFIFTQMAMYRFWIQKLMSFAETFANGFVLEKRTHFGGVFWEVLNT